MSQYPKGLPGPEQRQNGGGGGGGGGSVRRARERMNAGLNFEESDPAPAPIPAPRQPPPQRPNEAPRYPPPGRRQGPVPAALSSRNNQGPVGAAISRPTPVAQNAQWPLREDGNQQRMPFDSSRTTPRGPPPQRPPRPSHVPSILDSSKIHEYAPSSYNRQQQQRRPQPQQGMLSPPGQSVRSPTAEWEDPSNSSTPNTTSTPRTATSSDRYSSERPSTGSSVGSIPDFPVPAVPAAVPGPPAPPGPPRRGQNPGPPPTVRRGVSSYYSQTSFVSPIPEEMPEAMRGGGSIASSRVIPSSWGSRPDGFNIDVYADNIEEEEDDGRGSANSQHDESTGLVRKASLGKKAKPTLTTINSVEDMSQGRKQEFSKPGVVGKGAVAAGAAGGIIAAGLASRKEAGSQSTNGNRTILLDSSSTESPQSSGDNLPKTGVPISRSRSPLTSSIDPGKTKMGPLGNTPTGMSEKIPSSRRPPRLNVDPVRDTEVRGSLTSLPDLIRRATRLAANLDRGKTASRIGLQDIMNAENPNYSRENLDEKRRSGSMSDMLASFPPPGVATPTGERPVSRWPSPFSPSRLVQEQNIRDEQGSNSSRRSKGGRRCCGMSLWVFLLLLLVIFLLVAAAVVVPVVLIVLPRMKHPNNSTTAAADGATGCAKTNPCQNGGVSVTQGTACSCVCVNGFTGSTCSVTSDASCTTTRQTINTTGQETNATIGSSIPRLLSEASTNFSIPLDNQDILSLFSASNISCTSENALVTFSEQSSKRSYILPDLESESPISIRDNVMGATPVILEARQVDNFLVERQTAAPVATTAGIVYEPTTTTGANGAVATTSISPTAPTVAASSGSQSSTSGSDSSTGNFTASGLELTTDVLDFASIVVLFVLEETNTLTSAVTAQEAIQEFFTGSSSSYNMSMSGSNFNFTLNFSDFSIILSNGTIFGGNGDGTGGLITPSNSTTKRGVHA